jgi:hypothetical protein
MPELDNMPLSLFNHNTRSHFRELSKKSDAFGHTFGGDPASWSIRFVNLEDPLHLIYRLNLVDPSIDVQIPGVSWLPLCYGFRYAAFSGTFIYRVINDCEIELIDPAEVEYRSDVPCDKYPDSFDESPVSFAKVGYDPSKAEEALSLAAIFGIDQLSDAEMKRAIDIVEQTGLFREWSMPDWSPESIIRCGYKEPFMQGAPSKSCDNPECTAENDYYVEPYEIQFPEDSLLAGEVMRIEGHYVRKPSMRVFAIYQPEETDTTMWDDPYVQLVYEICDCCKCIRVSNQCT